MYRNVSRPVGEAASVDAGARAGGPGHRGEGEHQGAGEGHRAHRQDDRQVLRREGRLPIITLRPTPPPANLTYQISAE